MRRQKLFIQVIVTALFIAASVVSTVAQNVMDYPASGGQKLEIDLETGGSV